MRHIGPLIITLALLLLPGPAAAFTVLKTSEGIPLRWEEAHIPYYIGHLSDDLPTDEQVSAIFEAAATWEDIPGAKYTFVFMGFTDVSVDANDDINVIMFTRENWRWSESAVAITRNWATGSGRMFGFDMMLNDEHFLFTTTSNPEHRCTDLQNTLTHEFGHVLGLSHSNDNSACMYATATRGETSKRLLSDDDVNGIGWLYPDGHFTSGCDGLNASNSATWHGIMALLICVFRRRPRAILPQ